MSVVWFSHRTNSSGRCVETKAHNRLRDARDYLQESGYIERQEWINDWEVGPQTIHSVLNFVPSATEESQIRSRITEPCAILSIKPAV